MDDLNRVAPIKKMRTTTTGIFHCLPLRWFILIFLAVLTILTGYSVYYFNRHAAPEELFIFTSRNYLPAKEMSVFIQARDGRRGNPLPQQPIALTMKNGADNKIIKAWTAVTDPQGGLLLQLPGQPPGTCFLTASCKIASATVTLPVMQPEALNVSTDRPLYRPGQTIHLRALLLSQLDLKPVPEREVNIQLFDGRENKVFDQNVKTSQFGIAAADFPLASQVNAGVYRLRASAGETEAESKIEVKDYALPRFRVNFTSDRNWFRPGDEISGTINTEYLWNKPMANAKVEVIALTEAWQYETVDYGRGARRRKVTNRGMPFFSGQEKVPVYQQLEKLSGYTDATGKFRFKFRFSDNTADLAEKDGQFPCKLEIKVTDPAGVEEKITRLLKVTWNPLRLNVIPEWGKLMPGIANRMLVFTCRPDGTPVPCTGTFNQERFSTSHNGLGTFTLPPNLPLQTAAIKAADADNNTAQMTLGGRQYATDPVDFIIKNDKPVYTQGEKARLEFISNAADGTIYYNLVNGNTSLQSGTVTLNHHQASLELALTDTMAGTLQLHAYRFLPEGKVNHDVRLIQVNTRRDLTIKADFGQSVYRPGQTANIKFQVTNAQNQPVQAALSLAAVDEAVLAGHTADTFADRAYFLLQEELLKQAPAESAALLVPAKPLPTSRQDEAAYVLANHVQLQSLASVASQPFSEREKVYVEEKDKYGEWLISALVYLLLAFCLWLPLIAFDISRRNKPKLQVATGKDWEQAQRIFARMVSSSKFMPISALVILLIFSIRRQNCRYDQVDPVFTFAAITAVVVILINAIVLIFMFHNSRRLFKLASPSESPGFTLRLLSILWCYGGFTILLLVFTVAECFFPDMQFWIIMTIVPIITVMIPLCLQHFAQLVTTSQTTTESNVRQDGFGSGIGRRRNYFWPWLGAFTLYGGSIFLVYFIMMVSVLSMFLPLFKIVEKLGDGGGYSNWNNVQPAKMFPQDKSQLQFTLEQNELLRKMISFQVRRYFPETLYWQPELVTDEHGRAEVSFNVADAITNYRFNVAGITRQGQLDNVRSSIRVFQNFFVDFNPPSEVTANDELSIPAVIYNYLDEPQKITLALQPGPGFTVLAPLPPQLLPPQSVRKVNLTVRFTNSGTCKLRLGAMGNACQDAIEREITVKPYGKKCTVSFSDLAMASGSSQTWSVPPAALADGRSCYLKIYPSFLSQMSNAFENMVQRPYGCCEQLTSVTYLNIMTYDYLARIGKTSSPAAGKAKGYIINGYQRILTCEVETGGYSWYGQAPASLQLSAHVLTVLTEMDKIIPVDSNVTARLRSWLTEQQRKDGSWSDELAETAFITAALAAADSNNHAVRRACDYLANRSLSCRDGYKLVWCANALLKAGSPAAKPLITKIYEQRVKTGDNRLFWRLSRPGLFFTWGENGNVELTALAVSAMAEAVMYPDECHKACSWLISQQAESGFWGNPQTTIQTIRAILKVNRLATQVTPKQFFLTGTVNGQQQKLSVDNANADTLHYLDFTSAMRAGDNRFNIDAPANSGAAYQLLATYYLPWAKASAPKKDSVLDLSMAYVPATVKVGDLVTAKIALLNYGREVLPMGIIVIPVPPGLEVQRDSLERLKTAGIIDLYAIDADSVTLYCPKFGVGKPLLVTFELRAQYPVRVVAGSARAYPYYQPELVTETGMQTLLVKPARQGAE